MLYSEANFFSDRQDSVVNQRGNAKHVRTLVKRRWTAIALSIEPFYRESTNGALFARRLWIFIARLSPPVRIFLVTPESALCDVIESRERSYASQRVISPKLGGSWAFCPSSRAFSPFQRGDRMIKLPIDSHLFSSLPPWTPPVRPSQRRMRGTGATVDHKTRTTSAKLLAHRFISPILPYPQHPPRASATSLLVSSVRFRRIQNPTFKHARGFRLMRTNCASLYSDYDRWFHAVDIYCIDRYIFILHRAKNFFYVKHIIRITEIKIVISRGI